MAQKYLVVVDVQKDFVSGSLGSAEAQAMLPALLERIRDFDGPVLLTRDTHYADYLATQEGKRLPVVHCVEGSEGWQFVPELEALRREHDYRVFEKETFGSTALAKELGEAAARGNVDAVFFAGLCTDICVVCNALLVKSFAPQVRVAVLADCCAGSSVPAHEAALSTMASCQIDIIRDSSTSAAGTCFAAPE